MKLLEICSYLQELMQKNHSEYSFGTYVQLIPTVWISTQAVNSSSLNCELSIIDSLKNAIIVFCLFTVVTHLYSNYNDTIWLH